MNNVNIFFYFVVPFFFSFFIFFFLFFFHFQPSEQTPKPGKNRRTVPIVKMTIPLKKIRFWGLCGQGRRQGPFEGDPASMFLSFFHTSFSQKKRCLLFSSVFFLSNKFHCWH